MSPSAALEISTERFRLRPLAVADASDAYLNWFGDAAAKNHIPASSDMGSLDALRDYIRQRAGREDVLFLGIFDRGSGMHLGNIKYEPVDSTRGFAVMGILIGERAWRGKGVAQEVLRATADWLRRHRNIREIVLGVSADNLPGMRAYEAVGFVAEATPHVPVLAPGAVSMVWRL